MGSSFTCDWCGEPIECRNDHPPQITVGGIYTNGGLCASKALTYHGERGDPDSCLAQAFRMLQERARWAQEGSDSGLRWALVDDATRPRQGRSESARVDNAKLYCKRFRESDLPRNPELSNRVKRALVWAGVWRREQVVAMDDAGLLAIEGIGAKSLREIRDVVGGAS